MNSLSSFLEDPRETNEALIDGRAREDRGVSSGGMEQLDASTSVLVAVCQRRWSTAKLSDSMRRWALPASVSYT